MSDISEDIASSQTQDVLAEQNGESNENVGLGDAAGDAGGAQEDSGPGLADGVIEEAMDDDGNAHDANDPNDVHDGNDDVEGDSIQAQPEDEENGVSAAVIQEEPQPVVDVHLGVSVQSSMDDSHGMTESGAPAGGNGSHERHLDVIMESPRASLAATNISLGATPGTCTCNYCVEWPLSSDSKMWQLGDEGRGPESSLTYM